MFNGIESIVVHNVPCVNQGHYTFAKWEVIIGDVIDLAPDQWEVVLEDSFVEATSGPILTSESTGTPISAEIQTETTILLTPIVEMAQNE